MCPASHLDPARHTQALHVPSPDMIHVSLV